MALRRPLVRIAGRSKELPVADRLDFAWLDNLPTSIGGHNITLVSGDITTALGYTPVNRAGDTMTGNLGIGTQSGGAVGLLRLEDVSGARAGFTTTGSRRYTIGTNGALFTLRDESGSTDRLSLNSTGDFSLTGTLAISGAVTAAGDLLVNKSNAIVGVGISGTRNGGVTNYGVAGVGQVGLFSDHSGGFLYFRPNGRTDTTGQVVINGSGHFLMYGDDNRIYSPTTDGSDTARLALSPAGALSNLRGAYALLHGNEHATSPGEVVITAGFDADLRLVAPGIGNIELTSGTGTLTFNGDQVWDAGNQPVSAVDTADTLAKRNSVGDLYTRLFRSTFANQTTISGAMAYRVESGTDNYIRFCSDVAAIRTFLTLGTANNVVFATVSDSKGDLRDVIGVTRNSTTAFSAADAGKAIVKNNTTAYTWAVNTGVWYYGMTVTIINDGSAGNVTIDQGSGMALVEGTGAAGDFILEPGQSRTLFGLSTTRVRVL